MNKSQLIERLQQISEKTQDILFAMPTTNIMVPRELNLYLGNINKCTQEVKRLLKVLIEEIKND